MGGSVGSVGLEAAVTSVVLAHDEHYWVAERPAEVIALRRARLGE